MILKTLLALATMPRPEKLGKYYEPKKGDRSLGLMTDVQMVLASLLEQHTASTNAKIKAFNENCERRLWTPGSKEYMEADHDVRSAVKENKTLEGIFWLELAQEFNHDLKNEGLGFGQDGTVYACQVPAIPDGSVLAEVFIAVGGLSGFGFPGMSSRQRGFRDLFGFGGREGACEDPDCLIHGRNAIFGRR